MKHRIHLLGLPLPTSRQNNCCAYTQKTLKFAKMMANSGHDVIHYGTEGSEVDCSHVDILPAEEAPRGYLFEWDSGLDYWQEMNANAIREIAWRAQAKDFLCLLGGVCQKPVADAVAGLGVMPVEYGIGYYGCFAPHKVFESYWHMSNVYGKRNMDTGGQFTDAVIPNYFDTDDFPVNEKPGAYALFMGRMIEEKGLEIAVEATRRSGHELILAGPRATRTADGFILDNGRPFVGPHLNYVGPVGIEQRAELMSNALAVLVPTIYLEPFGGVAVEAQLCGTPVISTDWGGMTETVIHGMTGYRCRWLEHFVFALRNVHSLDRGTIARRARHCYGLERIGGLYEEYFNMVATLWGDGWNTPNDARTQSGWLQSL